MNIENKSSGKQTSRNNANSWRHIGLLATVGGIFGGMTGVLAPSFPQFYGFPLHYEPCLIVYGFPGLCTSYAVFDFVFLYIVLFTATVILDQVKRRGRGALIKPASGILYGFGILGLSYCVIFLLLETGLFGEGVTAGWYIGIPLAQSLIGLYSIQFASITITGHSSAVIPVIAFILTISVLALIAGYWLRRALRKGGALGIAMSAIGIFVTDSFLFSDGLGLAIMSVAFNVLAMVMVILSWSKLGKRSTVG